MNLEPTAKDDWYVTLLSPNLWRSIVAARAAQQAAPRDAQLWLALSRAYIKAVPFKYEPTGGKRFMQLGIQAMQRAVALAPGSAAMHLEYANLLWYLYRFDVAQHPNSAIAKNDLRPRSSWHCNSNPDNADAKALQIEIEQEISQYQ